MRKNFIVYHLPLLLYAVLIFIGSSLHSIPHSFPFSIKDKLLHFAEYSILGALLTRSIIALLNGILRRVYLLWIGLIGILYAATDELHQYFVPGRSCDFTDWLADIAGLACGALIIYIIAMGKKKTDQADQQIIG